MVYFLGEKIARELALDEDGFPIISTKVELARFDKVRTIHRVIMEAARREESDRSEFVIGTIELGRVLRLVEKWDCCMEHDPRRIELWIKILNNVIAWNKTKDEGNIRLVYYSPWEI